MSYRSLALILLFVLGCGGSLLAGIALAGGFEAGFLDKDLYYEDNGEKITFTHTGTEDYYWFVVQGKITGSPSEMSDTTIVAHEDLTSVKIYRITPVSFWELDNGFRPCRPDLHDCPLPLKPLPPPPPPIIDGQTQTRPEQYAFSEARH